MFIDFSCQVDFKVELLQDESTALKELLKNPTCATVALWFYLLGCAPPNFSKQMSPEQLNLKPRRHG